MVGKNDLGAKPDKPIPVFPEKPVIIHPQEEKPKKPSLIEPEEGRMKKPLVIEPDEPKPVQVKPAMPELKGDSGKKTAGVKIPKKAVVQEESRVVTLMLLLSFIFLAGGMAFLVLPILNIPLPGWLEPVMDLYRKVPFPGG